jgi:ATP-dependent DNA helicase RecQ
MNDGFKANQIVNVLVGQSSNTVKTYGFERLETFGEGADEGEHFWHSVIRQAMVNDFLTKNIEKYGTLLLSEKGKKYLENPYSILFAKDQHLDAEDSSDEEILSGAKGAGALDETLMALLKDLRKKLAKESKVPPFVIFQDPSLDEMATRYPISMDELKEISGVGEGKASKYGKPFLELIKKYVEDNEIERPQDIVVVRNLAGKSDMKVHIIQSVDRKMPIEMIAKNKGLEIRELLTEMESIVNAGTRLNLDYYINSSLGADEQEELFDYFRSTENADLEEALREYEDAYSEEEIRLMRIKFISDLGN